MEGDALKLDLSPDDVSTIATKAYYTTNLLPLRMRLLGLDPAAMAQSDPRLLRSLETSCKLCEDKGQCAFDISQNPAHRRWQDYCPNAATLRDLHARKV
jgi:hypothetical protein